MYSISIVYLPGHLFLTASENFETRENHAKVYGCVYTDIFSSFIALKASQSAAVGVYP